MLYISRVPGSRDIIFSPFKPQLKNVTGEDVANSLYYIHLETPADLDLHTSPGTAAGLENQHHMSNLTSPLSRASSQATRSPIARKPLPNSARTTPTSPSKPATETLSTVLSRDRDPESPTKGMKTPLITSTEPSPVIRQTPGITHELGDDPEMRPPVPLKKDNSNQISPIHQAPILRKPLGPRALSSQSARSLLDSTQAKGSDVEGSLLKPNQGINGTDVRPNSSVSTAHLAGEHQVNNHTADGPRSEHLIPLPQNRAKDIVPFTLTVIRRDPSTGNQWNVGKVSSYQLLNPESPTLDPDAPPTYAEMAGLMPTIASAAALSGPSNISIRLETSGYAKFRGNFPTRDSVDINRRQRAASAASSVAGSTDSLSILRGSGAINGEEFFTRQLLMSYQKSWTSNIKQAWKSRNRSNSSSPPQPNPNPPLSPLEPPPTLPFHSRARSGSAGSVDSLGSARPGGGSPTKGTFSPYEHRQNHPTGNGGGHNPHQLITTPGPGLRPRGYAFASPWDGICEFRTSSSGRGVKCVHSLPGGGGHSPDGGNSAGTTVSELRFNLPSAEMFRDKGQELQERIDRLKVDGHQRLQDQWGKGHRRGNSSLDSTALSHNGDEHHDGIDLSLGRERAGGGNRGKRAKLGKLIVHEEGLKMLDLLVAANVGVWWGAWERSFGP